MASKDKYEYSATLNAKQVEQALRELDKRMVQLGDRGQKSFGSIQSKMGSMATSLGQGAVMGAASALTTVLIQLGAAGVQAFTQMMKSSQQAAQSFDVTKRKFTAIFAGNEDQAVAVMERLTKKATALGMDMNEALSIARSFTPDVKGTEDPLEQLDNLLVAVRALAEEDPAQGIIGARYALDEAMSGSLRSMKARFEFTAAEIKILKSAQKEMGEVVGTIEGINAVMARRGVDMEALKGTYQMAVGEMSAATSKLQVAFGKPMSDAMIEAINKVSEQIVDKLPELQAFVAEIGDVVAVMIEFFGELGAGVLESIDMADAQALADTLFELTDTMRTFSELVIGTEFDVTFLDKLQWVFDKLQWVLDKINEAMEVLMMAKAITNTKPGTKAALDIYLPDEALKEAGLVGTAAGAMKSVFPGLTKWLLDKTASDPLRQKASIADETAYAAQMKLTARLLQEHTERVNENRKAQEERRAELEKDRKADEDAAAAFLRGTPATGAAALTEEDTKAVAEYKDAALKAEEDYWDKLTKIQEKGLQAREDLEIDAAQAREDIERESYNNLEDIHRKYVQDVQDAQREIGQDIAKTLLEQSRETVAQARAKKDALVEIEKDYQRAIADIQTTFGRAQEDAIESQDAIAYYEALKARDRSREDAREQRDEQIEDTTKREDEKAELLREKQAQELADLQVSNQIKLDELNIRLQQEEEAEALAKQRAYDELVIDNERRYAELQRQEERELAAAQAANEKKLADLKEELSAEALAFLEAEQAKTAYLMSETGIRETAQREQHLEQMARMQEQADRARELAEAAELDTTTMSPMQRANMTGPNALPSSHSNLSPMQIVNRMASGGNTSAGLRYMVGENGPELFESNIPGHIYPTPQVRSLSAGLAGGSIQNNNTFSPQFALNNPAVLSPEQAIQTRIIAEQMATNVMRELLGEV